MSEQAPPVPTSAPPIFKSLNGLIASLRADLYGRFMRRAQRATLLEWRDRTEPPGVAARMEPGGIPFYRFSPRSRPRKGRGYYLRSGRLRAMLLKRRPRSKRGADIVTVLKYGGGALNFLTDVRGVTGRNRTTATVTVSRPATQRRGTVVQQFDRPGGVVVKSYYRRGGSVRAHQLNRTVHRVIIMRGGPSLAAEFGRSDRDNPWLAKRTAVLFATIARRATVDRRTGGIKSSVLQEHDQ